MSELKNALAEVEKVAAAVAATEAKMIAAAEQQQHAVDELAAADTAAALGNPQDTKAAGGLQKQVAAAASTVERLRATLPALEKVLAEKRLALARLVAVEVQQQQQALSRECAKSEALIVDLQAQVTQAGYELGDTQIRRSAVIARSTRVRQAVAALEQGKAVGNEFDIEHHARRLLDESV